MKKATRKKGTTQDDEGWLPIQIIPNWLLKAETGIDLRGRASDVETHRAMLARLGVWQWPEDLIKEEKN